MAGIIPRDPAIYHITHVENLPSILQHGGLWSDSERIRQSLQTTNIGHKHIKARRLRRAVTAGRRGNLGEYVPFYFCNRSVMLYPIKCGHPDYAGGQDDVIHLVSSINAVTTRQLDWVFTDRHAELNYAIYYDDLADLSFVDWTVMPLQYWNDPGECKEKRQAEFLVFEFFPWVCFQAVGVRTQTVADRVRAIVQKSTPPIVVEPSWYY
jgi:hypothetical protein